MNWVDKIFKKMEMRYGTLWLDRYGFIDRKEMAVSWAEDLFGLSGEEIALGLRKCADHPYPPNVGEFRLMCRQKAKDSEEDAFHKRLREANEQWAARANMITDSCSKEKAQENLEKIRSMMSGAIKTFGNS